MSLVTDQLAATPIERWVKQVEFVSSADLDNGGESSSEPRMYSLSELSQVADQIQLAKRSKPSYEWQPDEQEKWWRIWFKESNLTIQIDSHFSDGKYQMNMYEIDLEQAATAKDFVSWLYHGILGKTWGCPEMLWAVMEVADEASEKRFRKSLSEAYSAGETLNWQS